MGFASVNAQKAKVSDKNKFRLSSCGTEAQGLILPVNSCRRTRRGAMERPSRLRKHVWCVMS